MIGPDRPGGSARRHALRRAAESRLSIRERHAQDLRAFVHARARLVVEDSPGVFRPLLTAKEIAARVRASGRPGCRAVTRAWVLRLVAREWPALFEVRGEGEKGGARANEEATNSGS